MANIKITVEGPLMDGHKITFKAPCNCDVVEKLDVRYIENNTQKSKLFTMKDSHGKDLTGLGNLFFKDAYVDVVLDINTSSAYLQNASTNTYLEEKIKFTEAHTPVDNLLSDRADLPLSARQGKILNESLEANDGLKFRFSTDGEGNYGYLGADDSFIPFKSGLEVGDTLYKADDVSLCQNLIVGKTYLMNLIIPTTTTNYSSLFSSGVEVIKGFQWRKENDWQYYVCIVKVLNSTVNFSNRTFYAIVSLD